jgi:hypothetical protein
MKLMSNFWLGKELLQMSLLLMGVTDRIRPLVNCKKLEKNYCKCHCYY